MSRPSSGSCAIHSHTYPVASLQRPLWFIALARVKLTFSSTLSSVILDCATENFIHHSAHAYDFIVKTTRNCAFPLIIRS